MTNVEKLIKTWVEEDGQCDPAFYVAAQELQKALAADKKLTKESIDKYAGLQELTDWIIKRVRGEVGDILLPMDLRVEGVILDWVKEVEKR
jgi:hypothetical protein